MESILLAPVDLNLLLGPPEPEDAFRYVPLPAAAYLDKDGFLPREHRKANHSVLCTMLRRALFDDELIRFIAVQNITGYEVDQIVATAWTEFGRVRAAYSTKDRQAIREHLYGKYRPDATVPDVPAHLTTPPMDSVYVSGRKHDTWACELKIQRRRDGEDAEVPGIFNLDIDAVVAAQISSPPQSQARGKRPRQLNLDSILAKEEPSPKRSRKTALEQEIACIKQMLEAKEKELLLL